MFDICKVSLLGTLQNIAGWDGITEITSEGQFEMHERIKHGYAPCWVCVDQKLFYSQRLQEDFNYQ